MFSLSVVEAAVGGVLPHAYCLNLDPGLITLHAVSDAVIALSYYSIPLALAYLAWRRRDLRYRWMLVLFGLFIIACGSTHLMHIWTLYRPDYLLEGGVKVVTAVVSAVTAVALWPLLPRVLALPSPAQLTEANDRLAEQVVERERAERTVRSINAVLEARVQERTAELERSNAALRLEIERRIQSEQALRDAKQEADQAKEAAERANLTKSKFLAAASHDLRQPVQALFYFIGALTIRLEGHPAGALLPDFDRALSALRTLLDGLLDISKLDAGVVRPQLSSFPIGEVMKRMLSEFAPAAAEKGVQLRMVDCAAVVRSDPSLLARVLQNLVANAVRYTEAGKIVIGCRRRAGTLRLEVWDSGIGIPADLLDDVFEEFFQVGNAERDRGQGLGLGLAIVKRLAGLLGHRVEVRSRVERGTMFAVELPLVRAAQPAADPTAVVMVVDDDPAATAGLAALIEGWGMTVITAASPIEAAAAVARGIRPDVVVADYCLDEGTGLEAIDAVGRQLGAPVAAVIITAHPLPPDTHGVIGDTPVLPKPIRPAMLLGVLSGVLPTPRRAPTGTAATTQALVQPTR